MHALIFNHIKGAQKASQLGKIKPLWSSKRLNILAANLVIFNQDKWVLSHPYFMISSQDSLTRKVPLGFVICKLWEPYPLEGLTIVELRGKYDMLWVKIHDGTKNDINQHDHILFSWQLLCNGVKESE